MMQPLAMLVLAIGFIVAFILFTIFVMVPLFRGIGWLVIGFFNAIGWFVSHIFEFIGGMIGDVVRLLGSILALIVLTVLVPANVIIGRWSAAGHFAGALKRELAVAGGCVYRFCLRRPLKLFWLHGLLEGLEERVPEAMHAAPTSDTPSKRTGQFDGYTIVGSLRSGGSGGKLYVARPDEAKRAKLTGHPDLVVIKTFAVTEGSSLPQIVRESRALECAKQLGHVLEHGMDEHRFFYVMPYHAGDHLGIIARQMHAETDGKGLPRRQLAQACSYMKDLLATLSVYHEGGFWHKDIKPENIIVHDGRAHVVDLGLITPLKSAMTLTTHGTEYFRDPEMVRQALRGVKVHQVNGVKFDIYAAGAVLYFVLENTFPAHGGLSRFTHNSPEALRWIVKRAMAEYNQRYESAEMMLADLEVVTNAADPFAVKPAELPSMRGGGKSVEELDVDVETRSPQAAQVAAAGSPIPPKGTPSDWSRGQSETGAASVSSGASGRFGDRPRGPERRPRLRIVDWFTGKYVVDDPGSACDSSRLGRTVPPHAAHAAAHGPDAAGFAGFGAGYPQSKDEWKRYKKEMKARIKRDVGVQVDAARRTAREQIASAQARVRDVRNRVAQRQQRVGVERQPSPLVAATTIIVMAAIFLAVWFWPFGNMQFSFRDGLLRGTSSTSVTIDPAGADTGLPLLVVIDHDEPAVLRESNLYRGKLSSYRMRGYNVLADIGPDPNELRLMIANWRAQPTEVSAELEDIMAEHDLYGFLIIRAETDNRGEIDHLRSSILESRHPQAKQRRWPHFSAGQIAAAPERPYLLINDHPARLDSRVVDCLKHQLRAYESRGWTIITDDEAEVAVRKVMPAGGLQHTPALPERLRAVLAERELGGILYVYAPAGDAPPHERVTVLQVASATAE
jgi:serine/threonine protein kinase